MIRAYIREASRLDKDGFEKIILQRNFPTVFQNGGRLEPISSGSFGIIYKAKVTKHFQKDLRLAAERGWNVFRRKTPPVGTFIACKIEYDIDPGTKSPTTIPLDRRYKASINNTVKVLESRGTRDTRRYIQRVTQEAMIHAIVRETKGPNGVRGASHIPTFYMSFMDDIYGVHITISEYIHGVTMDKYTELTNTTSIRRLRQFENALRTLWYAGFAHFDTHLRNVMITPKRVILLDFGRAERIPPSIHEKLTRGIRRGDHMERLWKESGLRQWMDVTARKYGYYHPNIRGLRRFVDAMHFR